MKKILFALSAVALLFATSCKKDQNAPENPTLGAGEFLATIDNGANPQNAPVVKDGMTTKTTINSSNYVIWDAGDQISINNAIYITDMTGNTVKFVPAPEQPSQIASVDEPGNFAFYPSSITKANMVLPATQTYETGTVKNLPMYAFSENNQLTFHNICAALKIAIPSSITTCNKIVLSASQPIAGSFTMNGTKAVLADQGTSNTIEVNAPSGTVFSGTVYVAIPENTTGYTNFTIELKNGTTSLGAKTNPNAMPVEAGKMYSVTLNTITVPAGCFYFTNASTTNATCTLSLAIAGNAPSVNLKYYKSGMLSWMDFVNGTDNSVAVTIAPNETIYIYSASGNNKFANSSSDIHYFSSTSSSSADDVILKVGGKLSYLLSSDGSDKFDGTNNTYAFAFLFQSMSHLKDASALILPNSSSQSTTLPNYYYYYMFTYCSKLSSVFNSITAGTFGESSCCGMFSNCSALATDITITATTPTNPNPNNTDTNVQQFCFAWMFSSSGISIATISGIGGKLGKNALKNMFSSCSNLHEIYLSVQDGTRDYVAYTNANASNSLRDWLQGVGTSGNRSINVNSYFPTTNDSNNGRKALANSVYNWYRPGGGWCINY